MQNRGLWLFLVAAILGTAWAAYTEQDAVENIAKVEEESQKLANAQVQRELGYMTSVTEKAAEDLIADATVFFDSAANFEMGWESHTEQDAAKFIAKVNHETRKLARARVQKEWIYKTTLTDKAAKELEVAKENFFKYRAKVVPELNKFHWKKFKDHSLKRQFKLLSQLNEAALTPKKRAKFSKLINKMLNIYSTAKVKEYKSSNGKPTLNYNDVSGKFPDDYLDECEMSFYWEGWHNTVGRAVKPYFNQYVPLVNKIATLNGYKNNADRWQARYEIKNFEGLIADLWKPIEPLLKQIHAYVRRKLWEAHGKNSSVIDLEGPIPASLLGSIWGMNGISIYNITSPYPKKPTIDATPQLKAQNYNGLKMAKTAEKFFLSLGLSPMTDDFWKYSILERPKNETDIDCAQESFNFYDGKDYRTKYCAIPTLDDFGGIHHEIGKIENFMAWKKLPYAFQDSPNPGFSEVIGELVNQYVTSPTHLKALGLIDANWQSDKEQELNYLMQQALYDILFLPYAYSLDLWRWRVFQGKVTPENYNCDYWQTRVKLQGVEPPVDRDEQDLDPAGKHYVVNDDEYIKFFLNIVLQYQWQRSLCILTAEFDPKNPDAKPLYLCDITGNKAAGDKLKSMMALGASKSWQDALEIITGERKIDVTPLLEFFQPLHDWLKKENEKNNEKIGWNPSKKNFCKTTKSEEVSLKTTGDSSCRYS